MNAKLRCFNGNGFDPLRHFTAAWFLGLTLAFAPHAAKSQTELGQPAVVVIGSTFEVTDPYVVTVAGIEQTIPLSGASRAFEFGGTVPFVDPETGIAEIEAVHVWDTNQGSGTYLSNSQITVDGVPGRLFKSEGYTAVGYKAGDGLVGGMLGTQIDTLPISSRTKFLWELTVRFAGAALDQPWEFSPPGLHPATIWQLAAAGASPSLSIVVDTDPADSASLALHFNANTDSNLGTEELGTVAGLQPQQDIDVVIAAYIDERNANDGGQGHIRIWVNGLLVVDDHRPTLAAYETQPPSWSFGMMLTDESAPLELDRFSYWKQARMLISS